MKKKERGNVGIGALFAIIAAVVVFTILITLAKDTGKSGEEKTTTINTELKKLND